MKPGSLGTNFPDRPSPTTLIGARSFGMEDSLGENHGPSAPRMFDNGVQEYFMKYGGDVNHLAQIGGSNRKFRYTAWGQYSPSFQKPQALPEQPLLAVQGWLER